MLLALGGRVWLSWLGRFLVVTDPLRPVDALVVLGGGGRHRIEEGARLAVAGLAPWLVVTNTRMSWPGVRASYAELMAQEALWQGVPAQRLLDAPGLVTTTVEEAQAVRALAAERGWRSLLVVTDPWHTRRARTLPSRPGRRGRRRLHAPCARARLRDRRLVEDHRRRARDMGGVPETGAVSPGLPGSGER